MKKFTTVLFSTILLLALVSCSSKIEKLKWDEYKLSSVLPEPPSTLGEVNFNTDSSFWVDVLKISQKKYDEYINSCKEHGFNIDSDTSNMSFSAYNEDGYELRLIYYESDKELSIHLEAPMEMKEIQWPNSEISALLPVPESNIGNISWEYSSGFAIYIGNTSKEKYNEYVNKCIENGFKVDYAKGDTYYRAYNPDGYYLSLSYEGFNIVYITIDEPDETKTPESTDTPSSVEDTSTSDSIPVEEENTRDNSSGDDIRPEFKESMDSYEAFFDEYINFMETFSTSSNSIDMMNEYLNFLDQYTITMEQMDSIDVNNLSSAEYDYYIEVTSRITQKLLQISIG